MCWAGRPDPPVKLTQLARFGKGVTQTTIADSQSDTLAATWSTTLPSRIHSFRIGLPSSCAIAHTWLLWWIALGSRYSSSLSFTLAFVNGGLIPGGNRFEVLEITRIWRLLKDLHSLSSGPTASEIFNFWWKSIGSVINYPDVRITDEFTFTFLRTDNFWKFQFLVKIDLKC